MNHLLASQQLQDFIDNMNQNTKHADPAFVEKKVPPNSEPTIVTDHGSDEAQIPNTTVPIVIIEHYDLMTCKHIYIDANMWKSVRDKVTHFVLRKVENEFDKLNVTANHTDNNVRAENVDGLPTHRVIDEEKGIDALTLDINTTDGISDAFCNINSIIDSAAKSSAAAHKAFGKRQKQNVDHAIRARNKRIHYGNFKGYKQNPLQRGFTENSAPLNDTLIIDEFERENKDLKKTTIIGIFDAKSDFDVVCHSNMIRKLCYLGLSEQSVLLIDSLYTNATTKIKWNGQLS
ncbi:unnamed protein product [Mytilus edulis]|uniref:Reverse transcriptase domain-containing protein n=1 Tax=Mytilus edulis TaxID=6550 RepID=A0A8S3RQ35_MYTED|nr:unnamed protein product [Mytilus edulis]